MKISHIVTEDGPLIAAYHEDSYYDLNEITGTELDFSGNSFYSELTKYRERIKNRLNKDKPYKFLRANPKSFLIPVPRVNQIRDFYSFEEHVKNARKRRNLNVPEEWYQLPAYYYSGNSSIFPSDADIKSPHFTSELDFELEVAAIVGKEGHDIPRGDALDYVFGFILVNDWSARDLQRKEMAIGLGPSKSKDFATTFGRNLVTVDEVSELMDQNHRINTELTVEVNGKEVTGNNLNTMHWTFQDLISWASTGVTLRPGDVIMSGTVGKGCILELGTEVHDWLRPGDTVRFRSDVFGELRSRII